ncbi:MAG: glycosyl transferase family 2 [Acidobacteria bacterium]|nr:MAG: glycosyl transferase family 2 [Acidobacteriota bacterium]
MQDRNEALDLSIVIPWSNRPELATTMRRNTEAFESLAAEVLVVNCGGDPRALESVVNASAPRCLRVIDVCSECFNKCLALNVGAFLSRASRLLFLDADIVISATVLAGMVERADQHSFVTMQWVIESDATERRTDLVECTQTMEYVWTDGQRLSFELFRSRGADLARGGPGLICVLREHFLAVHGMNSRLAGWGWEDQDLIIRLLAMTGLRRVLFGEAQHLAHDDSRRTLNGTTRHEADQRNMSICYANYERRSFLGTLRRDLVTYKDRLLEYSLPQKTDIAG